MAAQGVKPASVSIPLGLEPDRSQPVKYIQQLVGAKPTGVYDAETLERIKQWQSDNGLVDDGWFGPKTLNKFYSTLTSTNPAELALEGLDKVNEKYQFAKKWVNQKYWENKLDYKPSDYDVETSETALQFDPTRDASSLPINDETIGKVHDYLDDRNRDQGLLYQGEHSNGLERYNCSAGDTAYGRWADSNYYTIPEKYYATNFNNNEGGHHGVAEFATKFVGTPYVWGGNSLSNGVDCSGFTQQVFKAFGVHLPRVSYLQAQCGRKVEDNDLQPGDLLFWDNSTRNPGADHVAIYIGNGQMVEAPKPGGRVQVVPVRKNFWARRVIDPGKAPDKPMDKQAQYAANSAAAGIKTGKNKKGQEKVIKK